ncbi:hypothetical protein QBC32DRAFT_345374 [Pseudoneurospora amorphoporcata]|uniref:Uncharacterized protein n=1 Tax=Pseudoneurospora amorphoporcata TaxID=241081 RepID=A0AAN6SFB4_9PEZI|nr:hypothetical protein QBC32DRAFT_345374 [Pseudoneurospora amorphoporcata]
MIVVLGNDGGTGLVIRFRIGPERQEGGGSSRAHKSWRKPLISRKHQHGLLAPCGNIFPSHLVSLATAPLPLYNNPFTSSPLLCAAADIYLVFDFPFQLLIPLFDYTHTVGFVVVLSVVLAQFSRVLFSAFIIRVSTFPHFLFLITLLCTRYRD